MPRIFVTTRLLPDEAIDILRGAGDVACWQGASAAIGARDLAAEAASADALVCLVSDRVDATVVERAASLRIIANVGVGYNNIDVAAARRRGVVVTNTPDVLTDATADLTMALILAVARRVVESERFLREGKFDGWGYRMFWGAALGGKRLGVVGYGRIGRAVGRRAEAFGMVVEGIGSDATPGDVDALVARADVLSIHAPLTEQTRHLIDARRLSSMKPTAILINTARGPIVDEAALAEALVDGRIGGAGLDVFEHEPAVHARLLVAPNTVLLPHIGSATREARTAMATTAARNVVEVLAGRAALTPVWTVE